MARRSRSFARFPRKVSNYEWTSLISNVVINVPAATKVILGSFVLTGSEDVTLMRFRGMLNVITDATASELQVGAFGMMLVSAQAFAAGAASIPGPSTDGFQDWPVWMPIMQQSFVLSSAGFETNGGTRDVIDSKAQRKMQIGQTLAVMAENIHASQAFNVSFALRILSRLRT